MNNVKYKKLNSFITYVIVTGITPNTNTFYAVMFSTLSSFYDEAILRK